MLAVGYRVGGSRPEFMKEKLMRGFDETFDFVVVGSGGGSMCAGLVLRDADKSVVILEKADLLGGTTAMSGGDMWVPNNALQRRDGIRDSAELAELYLSSVVGDHPGTPGASAERRRTYVREAPNMLDFIMNHGVRIERPPTRPDYYDDQPGGCSIGRTVSPALFDLNVLGEWRNKLQPGFLTIPVMVWEARKIAHLKVSWESRRMFARVALRTAWAKISGKRMASAGQSLQGQMLLAALNAGVELRTGTQVTELIVEHGAACGVVVTRGGRSWRIGARLGVLVNAGGFAHNQRMRDRYQPGAQAIWSLAGKGDTGELIEEMIHHGAQIAQMEEMIGHQLIFVPEREPRVMTSAQSMTASPHAILVDQNGMRYLNEGGSYALYCKRMRERAKTAPAIPSWAIFDSQYMSKYMVGGVFPGKRKSIIWSTSGYLRAGSTIEELARTLGMEPSVLKQTLMRFNGFIERNKDEDFNRGGRVYDNWLGDPTHKPSPTLGEISIPPFYAIPVYPGDVGTSGGVVTDEQARVLRGNGSVIPGLYATGTSTASVMGRVYPAAGCSVGPSFTWGYIAARHALGIKTESARMFDHTTTEPAGSTESKIHQ